MAICEAVSCSIPVIATAVSGTPEVIDPRETGFSLSEPVALHLAAGGEQPPRW